MTTYMTYGEITSKLLADLSLDGEDFIDPAELLGYVNEGIRVVEAEVHTLHEDYFLSSNSVKSASGTVTGLVSGQEKYDLPADIYAHKIRAIVYKNGSSVYPITRMRDWKKIGRLEEARAVSAGTVYQYLLENRIRGQPQIVFSPLPQETGDFIKIWYIRTAGKFTGTDDNEICDVPEFVNFVMQFVKVRAYEKETGHPRYESAKEDLELLRQQMNATLAAMVLDADNEIEADTSFYEEHS